MNITTIILLISFFLISACGGSSGTPAGGGGWNYGIFVSSGNLSLVSGVSYQLGATGNGANTGQINP